MHPEMEEFLEIIQGTGKSDSTIQNYRRGLAIYSDWLDQNDLQYDEVSPRDINRYLSYLNSEFDYAPKTVRLRYTPVSQFYADLSNENPDYNDPTDPVRVADYAQNVPKQEEVTKQRKIWLTKDEVRSLVENVPTPTVRNRLVVLFQYFTGLRRLEVVNVKLADLDRENREVHVRGKGGKTNTVRWQPRLDGLLTAWLDGGYRDSLSPASESPYLFPTQTTEQMGAETVNKIVVQAAKNAGIQEVLYEDASGRNRYKYTSHTLRHSFAMHWLQNGGSIEALSKHMAHSSVTTTEIYGEILDQRASEEYAKYAPDIEIDL